MARSPEAPGPRGDTLVGANVVTAPASPVITVRGLRMSYGSREAVGGIDLEVRAGEVFAFLGPNGAGKTTTVEILEGFRRRTAGEVSVLGEDPERAGGVSFASPKGPPLARSMGPRRVRFDRLCR